MRQVDGGDGRDSGEAREPPGAAADGLEAAVGEDEVDGGGDGLAVDAEELVGRAVAGGRVRGHAEAFRDGLEVLVFFVDACAAAPPPGLVDEGAVRGIHEADDAVVDVAGEIGDEVGGAELCRRTWEARGRAGGWRRSGRRRAAGGRPRRSRRAPHRGRRWRRCGWGRGYRRR